MNVTERRNQSTTVAVIERYWREILRIADRQSVDPTRSFFELGGSSLQAVALAARLRDYFGVDITALTIVDHPDVEALGRYVDTRIQGSASTGDQDEGLL